MNRDLAISKLAAAAWLLRSAAEDLAGDAIGDLVGIDYHAGCVRQGAATLLVSPEQWAGAGRFGYSPQRPVPDNDPIWIRGEQVADSIVRQLCATRQVPQGGPATGRGVHLSRPERSRAARAGKKGTP
jgi:hypothetical protein